MTKWTPEMHSIAAGMRRAGLPAKAIAKRLGVTANAVQHHCTETHVHRHLTHRPGASSAKGRLAASVPHSYLDVDGDDDDPDTLDARAVLR